MKKVRFDGAGLSTTLSSGRPVEIIRSDDGSHYGFKLGPSDDGVKFCLTREAVSFILFAIDKLENDAGGSV